MPAIISRMKDVAMFSFRLFVVPPVAQVCFGPENAEIIGSWVADEQMLVRGCRKYVDGGNDCRWAAAGYRPRAAPPIAPSDLPRQAAALLCRKCLGRQNIESPFHQQFANALETFRLIEGALAYNERSKSVSRHFLRENVIDQSSTPGIAGVLRDHIHGGTPSVFIQPCIERLHLDADFEVKLMSQPLQPAGIVAPRRRIGSQTPMRGWN